MSNDESTEPFSGIVSLSDPEGEAQHIRLVCVEAAGRIMQGQGNQGNEAARQASMLERFVITGKWQ